MKNFKLNQTFINIFLIANVIIYILIPFVNVSFVKTPFTVTVYCIGIIGMIVLEIFLARQFKKIPADKEKEKEIRIKEIKVEEDYKHYANQLKFVNESRKVRHDFNNISQVVNSLNNHSDEESKKHAANILDDLYSEIENIQKGCE